VSQCVPAEQLQALQAQMALTDPFNLRRHLDRELFALSKLPAANQGETQGICQTLVPIPSVMKGDGLVR
jgi:hypothetical protein